MRTLFDQYAPRFDTALTERLAYRAPALLREAVEQAVHAAQRPLRFAAMLDLGCGTGLAGAAFAPLCRLAGRRRSFAGDDRAGAKEEPLRSPRQPARLAAFLKGELDEGERYDLVVAADVFAYVDDLAPVLAAAAQCLAPGGLFGFHGRDA